VKTILVQFDVHSHLPWSVPCASHKHQLYEPPWNSSQQAPAVRLIQAGEGISELEGTGQIRRYVRALKEMRVRAKVGPKIMAMMEVLGGMDKVVHNI
jgi:hypothetical protein